MVCKVVHLFLSWNIGTFSNLHNAFNSAYEHGMSQLSFFLIYIIYNEDQWISAMT